MAGIPLTPVLLVAAANALAGLCNSDAGAAARTMVESIQRDRMRRMDTEVAAPWDLAFVDFAGYWSHWSERGFSSSWQLPSAGTVAELAQSAGSADILMPVPAFGDVLLLKDRWTREFVRTGIIDHVWVARAHDGRIVYECSTIEGEPAELPDALPSVRRHRRWFTPTDGHSFIRWTRLGVRDEYQKAMDRRVDAAAQCAAA